MAKAVYPGTFDPVHKGHVDVAQRAAKLVDNLVVGVYDSSPKSLLFTTDERVSMFADSLRGLENVEVRSFSGLAVDFARRVGAKFILRGLRAGELQHLDLAFSRDQAQKRYVQDLLREQHERLCAWLAEGAAIYVCGSLQGMAGGVDAALRKLLGDEVVDDLIEEGRYRRDVY